MLYPMPKYIKKLLTTLERHKEICISTIDDDIPLANRFIDSMLFSANSFKQCDEVDARWLLFLRDVASIAPTVVVNNKKFYDPMERMTRLLSFLGDSDDWMGDYVTVASGTRNGCIMLSPSDVEALALANKT